MFGKIFTMNEKSNNSYFITIIKFIIIIESIYIYYIIYYDYL